MGLREQIQHWPKEDLKSFDDIQKDIMEVQKCNQQTKVLRRYHDDMKYFRMQVQNVTPEIVTPNITFTV